MPELGKFVLAFIDDILIYSMSEAEHAEHLHIMLQCLQEQKLYVKVSKCEFWLSKGSFLGHGILAEGISVDPSKVRDLLDWISTQIIKLSHIFLLNLI